MSDLSAIGSLSGKLSSGTSLQGSLSSEKAICGSLSTADTTEKYTGNYRVIPDTDSEIKMETKNKLLVDDVVIEKIPFRINDNLSDGLTVYIGV